MAKERVVSRTVVQKGAENVQETTGTVENEAEMTQVAEQIVDEVMANGSENAPTSAPSVTVTKELPPPPSRAGKSYGGIEDHRGLQFATSLSLETTSAAREKMAAALKDSGDTGLLFEMVFGGL